MREARGVGYAGQFAVVEPREIAGFAGVDDDVAGTGVEMGSHRLMAVGTGDDATKFGGVGGRRKSAPVWSLRSSSTRVERTGIEIDMPRQVVQ